MMILNTLKMEKINNDVKSNYLYRLTETEFNNTKVYGIEVEKVDFKNEIVINSEKDLVKIISPKKDKVLSLLNILYRNEVSPIHLLDVIGEYVDDYVSDFEEVAV